MNASADRRVILGVGALCLALAAVSHFHGHRVYLDRLDTARTLYPPVNGFRSSASVAPLARRTWIVIIDGLRDDVAAEVPALRELAADGVRRTLVADFPSFTYPALAAFETGIPGLYSGTRLNSGRVGLAYDSLDEEARRASVHVVLASDGWGELAGALEGPAHRSDRILTIDELLTRPAERELAWIHLERVDRAGHRSGAASRGYQEAARDEGRTVRRIAAALDPSWDVLLVVADHGHLDRGGHGGAEPSATNGVLLARGPALRHGVALGPGRQRDLCATAALLAGLPPPAQSLGWPMSDMLEIDDALLGPRLLPFWQERTRAERLFAPPLAQIISDPAVDRALTMGLPGAPAAARARLDAADRVREARRDVELRQRAVNRLPVAALAGTLAIAGFWWTKRRIRLALSDLLPLATAVAVFATACAVAGYRLSWSIPRGEAGFLFDTAIYGIASGIVALAARRPCSQERLLGSAALIFLACALAYVGAWWSVGGDPAWLGGPRVSFALPLVATFDFYVAGSFGVALLISAKRRHQPS